MLRVAAAKHIYFEPIRELIVVTKIMNSSPAAQLHRPSGYTCLAGRTQSHTSAYCVLIMFFPSFFFPAKSQFY